MAKSSLNANVSAREHKILSLYAEQKHCTMTHAVRQWIRSLEPELNDKQRAKLRSEDD